ncbi:MAG: Crp/Fnr family transcriptional regulator [Rhodopila sp.]
MFAPGALLADTLTRPSRYLIVESGLIATLIGGRSERGICVGLQGPGAVIGPDVASAAASGVAMSWRALGSVQAHGVSDAAFAQALHAEPALCSAYIRHLETRLIRSQQIAACNARHSLAARSAHWLLVLRQWLGDVVPVTHAFLATIVGARRAGVGVTLQALQQAGAISQARGIIRILDLKPLRAAACSCPVHAERAPDLLARLPLWQEAGSVSPAERTSKRPRLVKAGQAGYPPTP